MWTLYASVRCDFTSCQIRNSEHNLFVFNWCQPRWSDEPSVEASMALIGGFTSFPIVSMIIMLKMIEIIVISTCRIIALRISVPLVFEWSKSELKRARTIEFTEIPLNRPVCIYRTRFGVAGSLEPQVES
jgi:hypothetical protein